MLTQEELVAYNAQGLFPGPLETEEEFVNRIQALKESFSQVKEPMIPEVHWHWVRTYLKELFDFSPYFLPAFYSNRSLALWQGAASWIEDGKIVAVQLRKAFEKGSFLGIYSREEILAHEAVHAARSGFQESRFEEFFAYMTSENRFRRIMGPIIQRPFEVWPFVFFCCLGVFDSRAFLGAFFWMVLGFYRLIRAHWTLRKASQNLQKWVSSKKKIRSFLLRLTDCEIESLAKGMPIEAISDTSLRWKLLSSYLN